MKKRILGIVLCLVMVLTLLPLAGITVSAEVSAAVDFQTDGTVVWSGNATAQAGHDYTCVLSATDDVHALFSNGISVSLWEPSGRTYLRSTDWTFDRATSTLTIPGDKIAFPGGGQNAKIEIYATARAGRIPVALVDRQNSVDLTGPAKAIEGVDYVCQLQAKYGFQPLKAANISVETGGYSIKKDYWTFNEETGMLTVSAGAIQSNLYIHASAYSAQVNVNFVGCKNVTCNGNDTTVQGEDYTCTIMPESGYELRQNGISVAVNGASITSQNWTYQPATGQFTLNASAIGNFAKYVQITAQAVAVTVPVGTVRFFENTTQLTYSSGQATGSHLTFIGDNEATEGQHYTCWIRVEDGYEVTSQPSVSIGNASISSDYVAYDWTSGELTIAAEAIRFFGIDRIDIEATAYQHTHSFNEVVDPYYLKAAADCENPAVYYASCSCGLSGKGQWVDGRDLTFTDGEALGHRYGPWQSVDSETHKRTCINDPAHEETAVHSFMNGVCVECGCAELTVTAVTAVSVSCPGFTVGGSIVGAVPVTSTPGVTISHYEWMSNDSWDPLTEGTFAADTQYKLRVYLKAEDGYSLENLLKDNATIDGASIYSFQNPCYGIDAEYGDVWLLQYKTPPVTILLGDVNGDGSVNDADLTALLRHVAKIELLGNTSNADLNNDGNIDAADVTALAQMLNP